MTAHPCPVCGCQMSDITQTYDAKYSIPDNPLSTCVNRDCPLYAVTLTTGCHELLTASEIAAYGNWKVKP